MAERPVLEERFPRRTEDHHTSTLEGAAAFARHNPTWRDLVEYEDSLPSENEYDHE